MDRQTNGQIGKWIDRQMDRYTNGQIDKWIERQVGKRTNKEVDKLINRQMCKQSYGMDAKTNMQVDIWKQTHTDRKQMNKQLD